MGTILLPATLIADIILPCLKYKKIGNDYHLVGQQGRQQQAGAAHHGQQQPNGYTNRKNSYTNNIKERSLESFYGGIDNMGKFGCEALFPLLSCF